MQTLNLAQNPQLRLHFVTNWLFSRSADSVGKTYSFAILAFKSWQ